MNSCVNSTKISTARIAMPEDTSGFLAIDFPNTLTQTLSRWEHMHDVLVYVKLKCMVYIFIYLHIYRGGSGFSIPDWHSSQKFWAQRLARGSGKGSIGWKECYCHPAYREWQKPLLPATTFCWCGHSRYHLPNTQPDTAIQTYLLFIICAITFIVKLVSTVSHCFDHILHV